MSGYGTDDRPAAAPKDPLRRFLVGCVLVVAVVAAIAVGVSLLIGWQLARDEAPGRAPETFILGDEARYWCVALKPDDTGLAALFTRFAEINEATRRDLVHGTFLEFIPFPQRRARLDELAPLTLELSLSMSDPADGLPVPTGWAARGTLSRGMFKLRAGIKLLRFFATRGEGRGKVIDVDGVTVTEVRDANAGFAVATVGNRVLVANDAARMRAFLKPESEPAASPVPQLSSLHRQIAIEGEDAWAFVSRTRLPGLDTPFYIDRAAASFDVNDRDELAFRIIVDDGGSPDEGRVFRGTPEDCLALVRFLLPGVPVDAIEIVDGGAHRGDQGTMVFSGRIAGVSERLAALVKGASSIRSRERRHPSSERETPSAIPTPPPQPPPSGPRSDTPGGPTREGTPTPRR